MFTIISSILFVLLFLIWSRKGWTNFIIKCFFFGMACWGAFLILRDLGFIVKA